MSSSSLLGWRKLLAVFAMFGMEAIAGHSLTGAAESKAGWQVTWEKVLTAARAEGQVVVYGDSQGTHADIIGEFNRDHPNLKVVTVSGRGSQLAPRLVAERRAGKYLGDILAGGSTGGYRTLGEESFDPIPPALILPDVVDKSKWYGGKHHYPDPKNQYIFMYEGSVETGYLRINTNTFKKDEFKSYWDVLDKKWAGKILIFDPLVSSIQNVAILYADPRVGPDFVKRLFSEMNILISKERRQATDWLAQGVYPLCFFCRDIEIATKQGLPVDNANVKEAASTIAPGGNAALHLLSKAPHPNAAKVFLNWYLSRKGQIIWQKVMNTKVGEPSQSMRVDIPMDEVPAEVRRVQGVDYQVIGYVDTQVPLETIKTILDRLGK
jgi:iron(III) transport system substrate-binding protein